MKMMKTTMTRRMVRGMFVLLVYLLLRGDGCASCRMIWCNRCETFLREAVVWVDRAERLRRTQEPVDGAW
jgi:hypothetical protein